MPTGTPPNPSIDSLLKEDRRFPPDPTFSASAHIGSLADYERLYARSVEDPDGFWAEMAAGLDWFEPFTKVLDWDPPKARWFQGGKTNLAWNCLDRHLKTHRRHKLALMWEGEPGELKMYTYQQLADEVAKAANMLREQGVQKGDRVIIYMPMIPEAAISMLACARLGAPHTVVFGGFSAEALRDRISDSGATAVITADGGYRRGKVIALKPNVDRALAENHRVRNVVVVARAHNPIEMKGGRDHFWHTLMSKQKPDCPAEPVDSEHPLFILHTSGSTGKPKGVLHTTGGYMVQTHLTSKWVFDLRDDDLYWCTADIGWVTGHSYVVYGPLLNGASVFMYEGAPDAPNKDRFWRMIERHKISILYTAPTAIRTFIRWGDTFPQSANLSSLRLLGTVGEPINPEAWMWYHHTIGAGRCPIVDTWWQTETGSILMAPLPGATPTKPGSCTRPLPGIVPDIVHKDGTSCGPNEGGFLVVRRPWPSMLRTIWNDDERYRRQYWSEVEGCYFTGDGARRDQDGYYWVVGRIDDVLNVAGHRIGTAELESALVSHAAVAEAAVVGRPDEVKGQAVVAFVTLRQGSNPSDALKVELRDHVAKEIGPIAKPDDIRWAEALPKTRSGKIMRRLLKELATSGDVKGDTTTLEDFQAIASLQKGGEE